MKKTEYRHKTVKNHTKEARIKVLYYLATTFRIEYTAYPPRLPHFPPSTVFFYDGNRTSHSGSHLSGEQKVATTMELLHALYFVVLIVVVVIVVVVVLAILLLLYPVARS